MAQIGSTNVLGDTDSEQVATGVFQHRPGNWGFRANVPGGAGRQVRKTGFKTMLAAYSARNEYLGARQAFAKGANVTVGDWFARWLAVIRETRRQTTASNYRFAFDRMTPYIGDLRLSDLDEETLRAMYRHMATRYTTETLTTTHGRLRAALRAAKRENLLDRCPADNVTPPPGLPGRQKRTWTFDELTRFTSFLGGARDSAMWLFWITTGVRRGEVCGLYWSKVLSHRNEVIIDWQRTITAEGQVVEGVPKTDRAERIIPISGQVVKALADWRRSQREQLLGLGRPASAEDGYVFTTANGKPYHPSAFDDRLAKLAERAGLPVLTPHELRHTYASRCLEHGMDVKLVSAMLGHSKVETTMNLYQHVNPAVAHSEAAALAARMFA